MNITIKRLMELLHDHVEYACNSTLENDPLPEFVMEAMKALAHYEQGGLTIDSQADKFKLVACIGVHEKMMLDQGRTAMVTPGNPFRAGTMGDILLYQKKSA